MNDRIRWLVAEVACNMVGLDVALFFEANPTFADTAKGIAMRVKLRPDEVEEALKRLTDAGILECHTLADDSFRCYMLNCTPEVSSLLRRLSRMYHDDPASQREIIRMLMEARANKPWRQQADGQGDQ